MNRRVVITGLGTVSGMGLDNRAFWNALCAGRSAIGPLNHGFDDIKISVAATVPEFDSGRYFSADDLPLLDRYSQLAVIAAREAAADAGLVAGDKILNAAATIIGSGCGGKHTDETTYDQLYRQQRLRVHPLTIPKGMPSAAVSMVCLHLGIRGPAFGITSACASGAHAIIQGMTMIHSGMVDVAVVGAADAPFTYGLLKSWDALRVVSNDSCRPFSKDRSGMVLGEGAGMLVLESEQHARLRGARIYAEISGCGMTSDAGHITRPDVNGISNAMQKALQNAQLNTDEIDYINAHGTGTQANDIAETQAVHRVFGKNARKIAISSTKSMHAHALGASSALELVATSLAIHHGIMPPTANFSEAAEHCDLDYVPNQARERPIAAAMSNSFAFGGLNAVIILKKYSETLP